MKPLAPAHPLIADALVSIGHRFALLADRFDRAFWTATFVVLTLATAGIWWLRWEGLL